MRTVAILAACVLLRCSAAPPPNVNDLLALEAAARAACAVLDLERARFDSPVPARAEAFCRRVALPDTPPPLAPLVASGLGLAGSGGEAGAS